MTKKSSNFYLKAIIAFIVCCCLYSGVSAQTPVGADDGLYTFLTPTLPLNGMGVPGILFNDSNTNAFDSLHVISGTGSVNVTSGADTTIVTYTPGANDTGMIVIGYVPVNSATGIHGSETHVAARYWTSSTITPAYCVGDVIPVSWFVAALGWPSGGTYSSVMPLIVDSTSPTSLTAYSPGFAIIKRTFGGLVTHLFFYLCVAPNPANITGLDTLCVGDTTTMYDITPGGRWSSTSPSIASINPGGLVTALTPGTTLINYATDFHSYFSWMPAGAGGCMVSKVLTVLGVPAVSAITPLTSVSICVGDTIRYSDTIIGGTWSSSNTTIATIDSTGKIKGMAAGTATITYAVTNRCGTTTVTKSVTVNANPIIAAAPSSICRGDTFTLARTPTGGTWTTTAAAIASVGSSTGKVTCISGGTAVIRYALAGGCFAADTVTVKIPPTAIIGRDSICATDTVTFSDTATGGTWHSSATSVATVDSVTGLVTGVGAGTAVITYDNGCGMAIKTIIVKPVCLCVVTGLRRLGATGIFTSTEIGWMAAGGNFYIANNVTCTTSVTMTNCIIAMSKNTSITVAGSSGAAVLDIQGSHLFTCDSMWDGIIVSPGNRIILENSGTANKTSTLIEDAKIAVSISNPTTPAGYTPILGTPLILRCDGVTFNKNTIGIDVNNYVVTTAIVNNPDTLAETPSYPFVVKDAVFTSRQFELFSTGFSAWPYVWPQNNGSAVALKAGITPVTPYDPPYYIDLKIAPPLWLSVVPCNNGNPASTGINLTGVGGTTGSLAAAKYKSFVVGTATSGNYELVLFDNLCFGINAVASNVMVRNSSFEHIAATLTYGGGFGVYSSKGTSPTLFKLHIYGDTGARLSFNSFYDCATAVYGENMYYMKGRYAKMVGSPTGPCKHSYSSPFGVQAKSGYDMNSSNYYDVQLVGNTITNITTGINYMTTAPCAASGEVNVSQNTIQATDTGGVPSIIYKEYVHRGIVIQNLLAGTGSSFAGGSYINVDNNTLKYVYNGIFVSGRNQYGQKVTTSSNYVRLNVDSATVGGYHQYGIQHAATTAGYIYNNAVYGPGYNTPAVSTAGYPLSGIRIIEGIVNAATSGEYTECNTVQDVNSGFVFYGNCPNQEWINNMMLNNQFGFVLNGNIGNQPMHTTYSPAPKNVTGNIWDVVGGSGFPGWGTATSPPWQTFEFGGILPSNNKLAALSTTANQVPIANGSSPFVIPWLYVPSGSWTGGSVYTTIQPNLSCTGIGFLPPSSPAGFYRTTSSSEEVHNNSMLENLVTGQISYPDGPYKKAKEWMARKAVYDAIRADTALLDTSGILHQFMLMAVNSRYKLLEQIDNSINTADFSTASALLASDIDSLVNTGADSITGVVMADGAEADNVVANYRQYYQLLSTYATGTLTASDSAILVALSHKCPVVDGSVIYGARALYSLVFRDAQVFGEGDCDSIMLSSGKDAHNAYDTYGQGYSLYPNPNNGQITLSQKIADNTVVTVTVSDIVGKCVYRGRLVFDGGFAKLQLNQNTPGLYLLQLTDGAGKRFILKFTIN